MPKLATQDPGAALRAAAELLGKGRLRESRSILLKLLKQDPASGSALQLAGIVSSELGIHDQAVRYLERAKELAPSSAGTHLNLGKALQAAGRLDDAVVAFASALKLRPDNPDIYIACGGALAEAKRYDEAAKYYREAIRLDPASPDAYYNLAKILARLGKHDEALAAWEHVLHRESGLIEPALRISETRQELCDWKDYDARFDALRAMPGDGRARHRETFLGAAFLSLLTWDDAILHRQFAEIERGPNRPCSMPRARPVRERERIRLAYVSGDFRRHPIAKLATGLFETHDRGRFEVIGIVLNEDDGSTDYQRSAQSLDVLLDVHNVSSNDQIVQLMREHKIDIAIDLMGYTGRARPEIFMHRAAPIQVNFLGFPGTSAIPSMDYMVVDPFIATSELRSAATEKLVIMPDCYQCNDSKRAPIAEVPSRSSCGLPEKGLVFGNFNAQRKITPQVFDVWMRILQRVEDSVLWLYAGGSVADVAASNLRREAAKRRIAPGRLIVAGPVSHEEHIARIPLVDVHLDTFPYTSHTTGSDALWAGSPVVTLAGTSFPSRVCGSLLTTIGVPELITTSFDDYEALAVELAGNREMLGSIKQKITQGRAISPLFDTQRFCRNLEKAYEEMIRIAATGSRPAEIDVRSLA